MQPSTDLAEGRIQFYWGALAIVRPQVQAGKARLIAFSNTNRAPDEPGVPTVIEAGYPELKYDGLVGLFGPRDLAADIRDRIAADVQAAAADPRSARACQSTGQVVSPGGPAEFAASIDQQRAIAAAIAQEMGIKPADAIAVGAACETASVIPGRCGEKFGFVFGGGAVSASGPASRRDSRRSRAWSCGRASRPRRISPAAGTAGTWNPPGPRGAPASSRGRCRGR